MTLSIYPGRVLHADPDRLLRFGANFTATDEHRVRSPHFFLCVNLAGREGLWVPVYSQDKPARLQIPEQQKAGHWAWVYRPSFIMPKQVWRVPHRAIRLAARDYSTESHPNFVREPFVRAIGCELGFAHRTANC